MTDDQILGAIVILSVITFGALLYTAMRGELTVFHDTKDVLNSVGIFLGPVTTFFSLSLFLGLGDSPSGVASLVVISAVPFFWFSYQCFKVSIECNGQKWGIIIGAGKVFLSVLMVLFVLGLLNKIGSDKRNTTGTMILITVFFGAFAWVLKVLVNGKEAAEYRSIMNQKNPAPKSP
jgi:hypothetical protein